MTIIYFSIIITLTINKKEHQMEDITVTIEAPITEHCTKCDYEASRSLYSHLCKCPKCGEKSVRSGRRIKKHHVKVFANEGHYNLCSDDKQWRYIFNHIPEIGQASFVVDDEYDTSCPYALIENLKYDIDKYLYNSKQKLVNQVYDLLMDQDFQEKNDSIKLENDIYEAKLKLYKLLY